MPQANIEPSHDHVNLTTPTTTGPVQEGPPTPELDRRTAFMPDAALLTRFVDWLEEHQMTICKNDDSGDYHIAPGGYERMFADFFGLDLAKIDAEQRAIIEYFRTVVNQRDAASAQVPQEGH